MSQKRVLLLHEDRLLGNLFRDKLESGGFAVDSAQTGDAGLKIAEDRWPDAVAIDLLLPGADLGGLITHLRNPGPKHTPVIALPTSRPILAETAQESGATLLLRGVNPVADLVDALQGALGLEKTSGVGRNMTFHPEESWMKASFDSAPEMLTALRRGLQEINRAGGEGQALGDFLQRIHGFSEQMAVLGQRPLQHFAAQIEGLAFDLSRFPEQLNPSVFRTLGQAVDFLGTLLPDAVRCRLKDPGAAQVLVVDDEDGARKIIMAAMRVANLKSMAADTPTASLAALGVQGFDLIFLDVGLPEMNGFELCAKIRALPLHEKTPIIFITGMATFQNRVQSSLSGGSDFVGKPFNISELGLKALIWIFKSQLGQV